MAPRPSKPLRRARQAKIPKGIQPRLDQLARLARDMLAGYKHFISQPTHYRDSPARKRLEQTAHQYRTVLHSFRDVTLTSAQRDQLTTIQTSIQETVHGQA